MLLTPAKVILKLPTLLPLRQQCRMLLPLGTTNDAIVPKCAITTTSDALDMPITLTIALLAPQPRTEPSTTEWLSSSSILTATLHQKSVWRVWGLALCSAPKHSAYSAAPKAVCLPSTAPAIALTGSIDRLATFRHSEIE